MAQSAAHSAEAAEQRANKAADAAERARTEVDQMRAAQRAEVARSDANKSRQRAQSAVEDARQLLRSSPPDERQDARAELEAAQAAAARATTASDRADAHALRARTVADDGFEQTPTPRGPALNATSGGGGSTQTANSPLSQQLSAEYDRLPPAEQQRVPRDAYVTQRTDEYHVALDAKAKATQDVDARIASAMDDMGPNSRDAQALMRQRDRLILTATTSAVQDFRDTRDATALADQYQQDPAKWKQLSTQFNLPAGTQPTPQAVKDLLVFNRQVETRAQLAADAAVRNLPPSATDADAAAARQAAVAQVQLQAYVDRGAIDPPGEADPKQWVAAQAQLAGQEARIRRNAQAQGQDPDAAAATSEELFEARLDSAFQTGEVKPPEGTTAQEIKDRQLAQFREAVDLSAKNGIPMADAQTRIADAHALNDLRVAAQVNINGAVQTYNANTTAVQRGGETIRGWFYGDGVNHLDWAKTEFDGIEAKQREYNQLLLQTKGSLTPEQQQRADALKQEIEGRINLATTNVGLNVQHSLEQAARYKPVETALFQTVYAASSVIPGGVIIGASVKLLLDDIPNGRIRANGNVLETAGDVALSMAMGGGQVLVGKFDPTHGGTTTLLRAGTAPILEKAAVIAADGGLNALWAGTSSAVEQWRDPNRDPTKGIDWQQVSIDAASAFAGSAIGRVAKFGPAAGAPPLNLRQLGAQTLRESGVGFLSGSAIDAGTQYATTGTVDLKQTINAGFQNAMIAGFTSSAMGVGQRAEAQRRLALAAAAQPQDPVALTADPKLAGLGGPQPERDTSPITVRAGQVDPLANTSWPEPPDARARSPKGPRAPQDLRLTTGGVERGLDTAQAMENYARAGKSRLGQIGDRLRSATAPLTELTLKGAVKVQDLVKAGGANINGWWDDRLARTGTRTPPAEQRALLTAIDPELAAGGDPDRALFAARRGDVKPGGVFGRSDRALGQSDQGSFPVVRNPAGLDDMINGTGRSSLPDRLALFAGRHLAETWDVVRGRELAARDVAGENAPFAQTSPPFVPGLVEGEGQMRVRVEAYGRTHDLALDLPDAGTMKRFYAGDADAVQQVVGHLQGQIHDQLADPASGSMRTIDDSTVASAYQKGIPGQRTALPPVDLQINLREGFIDPIRDPGNINFGSGAGETPTNVVKTLYLDQEGNVALIGDRTAHAAMDGAVRETLGNGNTQTVKAFDAALRDPQGQWRGAEPLDLAQARVYQEGMDPAQQTAFGRLFQNAPQREVASYLDAGKSKGYEGQLSQVNELLALQAQKARVKAAPVTVDGLLTMALGVSSEKRTMDFLTVDPNNKISPVVIPVPQDLVDHYNNADPGTYRPNPEMGERILAGVMLGTTLDRPAPGKPGSASVNLSAAAGMAEAILGPFSNVSDPGRAQVVSPYDVSTKGMVSRLPDTSPDGQANTVVAFGTAGSGHYEDVVGVVKLEDGTRRISGRGSTDSDGQLDAAVQRAPIVMELMMRDIRAYQEAAQANMGTQNERPLPMLPYVPERELAKLRGERK